MYTHSRDPPPRGRGIARTVRRTLRPVPARMGSADQLDGSYSQCLRVETDTGLRGMRVMILQAAQRLRDSRRAMMAARTDIAEPTWTGRSGSAGAPRFGRTANPRFGPPSNGGGSRSSGAAPIGRGASAAEGAPSSSSLLAQLNSRQEEARSAAVDDRSPAGVPEADTEVADAQTLAAQILSYMQAEGGRVDGARLVQHFQVGIPPMARALSPSPLNDLHCRNAIVNPH